MAEINQIMQRVKLNYTVVPYDRLRRVWSSNVAKLIRQTMIGIA